MTFEYHLIVNSNLIKSDDKLVDWQFGGRGAWWPNRYFIACLQSKSDRWVKTLLAAESGCWRN